MINEKVKMPQSHEGVKDQMHFRPSKVLREFLENEPEEDFDMSFE